jgi:YhcH/YjgK/YiaL family protein
MTKGPCPPLLLVLVIRHWSFILFFSVPSVSPWCHIVFGTHMILDRLENADLYRGLGPGIAAALDYLRATDFSRVPLGRQELDGARLFAIVQRYRTKPLNEAGWEAHRRYLDVQYVVEGDERMGYAPLQAGLAVKQAYDPEKDIAFFETWGDLFEVPAGRFAIFAPQDVHAPGLVPGPEALPTEVLKVVVKVEFTSRP